MLPDKEKLKREIEVHFDVEHDLIELERQADWLAKNYHDIDLIPIPQHGDREIDLRRSHLEASLIKYRRCFDGGHRGKIDVELGLTRMDRYRELHQWLIDMANLVVAHPVHASNSSMIVIRPDRTITASIQRGGHNKIDFENIRAMCARWREFVRSELDRKCDMLRPMLEESDVSPNEIFVTPYGSNFDIQRHRARRTKK